VGITAPPGLPELARSIEHACARIGVQADNREYQPHLTLARIRQPVDLLPLKKAIAELPEADFGAFTAREYHLYRSELRPGGSLYTKLATFPFPA
jgi:2'-5' RNA ligase